MADFHAGIGKRWRIGGVWGCRIEWFPDYAAQRVCGWMTPKPHKGDWLLCEMQSGKTGVWRFGEIEHCGDPHDMFFAPVKACGYEEPNAALTGGVAVPSNGVVGTPNQKGGVE
jgi:hypothetical protein